MLVAPDRAEARVLISRVKYLAYMIVYCELIFPIPTRAKYWLDQIFSYDRLLLMEGIVLRPLPLQKFLQYFFCFWHIWGYFKIFYLLSTYLRHFKHILT